MNNLNSQLINARTLEQELDSIGVLPPEAIYLGTATDGLPVLYNLKDYEVKNIVFKCSSRYPFETIKRARSIVYKPDDFSVDFLMISNADLSCRVAYEKIQALMAWLKAGAIGQNDGMIVFVEDLGNLLSSEEYVVEAFKALLHRAMKYHLRIITCTARRIPSEIEEFFRVARETDYGSCLYELDDYKFWTPV